MLNPDTKITVHDFLDEKWQNSPWACLLLCIFDGLIWMYSNNQTPVPGKAQSPVSISLFYTSTNDMRHCRRRISACESSFTGTLLHWVSHQNAIDMTTSLIFYETNWQSHSKSRSYHASLTRDPDSLGRLLIFGVKPTFYCLVNSLLTSS